jgi:hypothetical protein
MALSCVPSKLVDAAATVWPGDGGDRMGDHACGRPGQRRCRGNEWAGGGGGGGGGDGTGSPTNRAWAVAEKRRSSAAGLSRG